MSKLSSAAELWEKKVSPFIRNNRESNGGVETDDSKKTMARVTQLIEQLHANKSSPPERELITARLLGIVKSRKEGRSVIGSHSQAMPLFVSILRNGTPIAKANVAATLSVLCKDDDLRVKVLLGGCIPPLLTILKSETGEARKAAAEAVFKVTSNGLADDQVGIRIFTTEGVVPALWHLLISDRNQDRVVETFVTGALRNLCSEKDGYWKTTLDAGGVDVVVRYLSSDNVAAQANSASLLARMMLASTECIPKIIGSGVINTLLRFLDEKNDVSLRASAAEALDVITSKSPEARKFVTDAQGVALFIGAVISPYKQGIEGGEEADALQLRATRALANLSGGMPALLVYLGELSQSSRLAAPVPDIIGTLAYALKIFEQSPEAQQFDAKKIENFLIMLLKPRDNKSVQDRLLEAMMNLYGNADLSKLINQSKAKRVLTGLIVMAVADVKESLIFSMLRLCNQGMSIWESIRMREGIQLLISLLGLYSEQQQEYAVEMLAILTDQVDDSKWAITAAGGIPPLVHLLDNGTLKAREYAAHALEILCSHSEEIRACVENADAIPSFLWLLKNGGPKGQETSASALKKLVRVADASTINQLSAMLVGDLPSSKTHIIPVLGHVLSMASLNDFVGEDAAAKKGFTSLVQALNSSQETTKECAAFTLADLFSVREDICDSLATEEVVNHCMKFLTNDSGGGATHSARALGSLSRLNKRISSKKINYGGDGEVKHLIRMAKTAPIASAETAMAALANLLSDPEIATDALYEDVSSALTRVLGEGSLEGKKNATRALHQLLKHFPIPDILKGTAQRRFVVLGVAESLKAMGMDGNDVTNSLDIIALLAKMKEGTNSTNATLAALAKVPSSSEPLVRCLCEGSPVVQDKAIEILSRICMEQPAVLSGQLISKARAVAALAERIINSSSLEVRIGGAALLICAARDYRHQSMEALDASGYLKPLVFALVGMMKHKSKYSSLEIEVKTPRGNAGFQEGDDFKASDSVTVSGSTLAMWLLSIISSFHAKNKVTIVEAGGLDVLADRLGRHTTYQQAEFEDSEGLWISTLLLAILFQDPNVVSSPTTIRFVPIIALLLKSEQVFNQFFAAQALSSLVCHRNEGINLVVSNSDAIPGLMTLIGYMESDIPNLFAIFIDFSLVTTPDQVVLERLFEIEDVRVGSIARKTIPLLVDLLKPMPNKRSAPPFAVRLLTQIAEGNDTNKLIMAEAGVLDALNKYLLISPRDLIEATISELLRILFSNHDLLKYEAVTSCMVQLVSVVRLGSRSARLSAIGALNEVFDAENIRDCEASMQAVQPLVEVLDSSSSESESEQQATISTLIKLTSASNSKAMLMIKAEPNPLEILYKILTSTSSLELKSDAAKLCFVIFGDPQSRKLPIASQCMEPLISLIQYGYETVVESGVCAFERLLDEEQQVELASSTFDLVDLLVGLVSGTNYRIIEASICALIKLGKDRTPRKMDMVKAGIIHNCLNLLPVAPISVCATVTELFRVLTNSAAISRSPAAAQIVEPLFALLKRSDFGLWGQHSALQALVNILEKPQSYDALKLTPSQAIEPLIAFLESPSHPIQQLATELLSHLLEQEHFKQDIMTKNAVVPLVQLAGIGILNLQQTAIKALENISLNWPKEVADAGGIFELSKFIIQDDPQPPDALLELAAEILCNILNSNSDYYLKVPLVVLVKILYSKAESTVMVSLNALTLYENTDPSSAELMAEAGVIDALLDLLRSHQCEEASGKLLEALFNKDRVREMKVSKYAIAPLAQYLLDPQTRSQPGRFLATLALGDLSRHEGLARASDSAFACRALIRVLSQQQQTEEICVVVVCALQNFIMRSRTNRRAVAESGGILAIQEQLLSPNSELVLQSALLLRCLFSNHTLQDCVSNDLIKSLTAALERDPESPTAMKEEILRTFVVIFSSFPKLHASDATTACVPHIVAALKSGSMAAQELGLASLLLLKQSWAGMPVDMSRAQTTAASEAIPVLQTLLKNSPPPASNERLEALLQSLPGCLTVTVKRASNLRNLMGGTNAFCRLKVGNGPARQTKVVSHSTHPEWNEEFTWAFDVPPRGQKLYILCRSRNTFGKTTLGRVSLQIDKVVSEGSYSEVFKLSNDTSKEGHSRILEADISWSNTTTSSSNEGE